MAKRDTETGPVFPIGLMARRTGLSPEGIRFYEAEGLLPAPARSEGRRRLYSPAHLKRLAFIRRARDLGFTLDEVRALLRLAESSRDTCAGARNMAADHLNDVRAKMADLRAMERVLSKTVSECDAGTHTQCPLIEALSRTPNSRIRKS